MFEFIVTLQDKNGDLQQWHTEAETPSEAEELARNRFPEFIVMWAAQLPSDEEPAEVP